jgi:hypothetical protein
VDAVQQFSGPHPQGIFFAGKPSCLGAGIVAVYDLALPIQQHYHLGRSVQHRAQHRGLADLSGLVEDPRQRQALGG